MNLLEQWQSEHAKIMAGIEQFLRWMEHPSEAGDWGPSLRQWITDLENHEMAEEKWMMNQLVRPGDADASFIRALRLNRGDHKEFIARLRSFVGVSAPAGRAADKSAASRWEAFFRDVKAHLQKENTGLFHFARSWLEKEASLP